MKNMKLLKRTTLNKKIFLVFLFIMSEINLAKQNSGGEK